MNAGSWSRYGWEFIDGEWRLRPCMPRIAQRFIGTSLYLYDTFDAARQGSRSGGSGMLVGQPSMSPSWVHLYAVTNAHVVEAGGIVARASTGKGRRRFLRSGSMSGSTCAMTTGTLSGLITTTLPCAGLEPHRSTTTKGFNGCPGNGS